MILFFDQSLGMKIDSQRGKFAIESFDQYSMDLHIIRAEVYCFNFSLLKPAV